MMAPLGHKTVLYGYPIKRGSNAVTITVALPTNYRTLYYQSETEKPYIYLLAGVAESSGDLVRQSDWETIINTTAVCNVTHSYVCESEFAMYETNEDYGIEQLGTNVARYVDECKSIAVELARLVKKQDRAALSEVIGKSIPLSAGILAFDGFYPFAEHPYGGGALIISPTHTNAIEITAVSEASDLDAEIGKHLILIHPKSCSKHVLQFDLSPKTIRLKNESLLDSAQVYIDSFVFGRVHGKWKFAVTSNIGSGWLDLDIDKLNKSK